MAADWRGWSGAAGCGAVCYKQDAPAELSAARNHDAVRRVAASPTAAAVIDADGASAAGAQGG
eukprot:2553840-Prymnesium_polylepis.1